MLMRWSFNWKRVTLCLDGGISIVWIDAEDTVHFVECDTERAFGCNGCAFDSGTGAVGDDRYFVFRTNFDNFRNFGVGFREDNGIWARVSVV